MPLQQRMDIQESFPRQASESGPCNASAVLGGLSRKDRMHGVPALSCSLTSACTGSSRMLPPLGCVQDIAQAFKASFDAV